jgi:hypothetical protein
MAIVVYAPSLALAQVTGLNMDLSIALTFVVSFFIFIFISFLSTL